VLELSKIEAGRNELYPENFDLQRLLAELEELMGFSANQKGLELSIRKQEDVPQYVHADKNKLRQVLINLLNNAVKFTEKGRVALCVSNGKMCVRDGNLPASACILHFEVQDTGAGIAPNELKDVFVPFIQTASGRQAQRGSGLGLAISFERVSLMGGKLHVESALGVGSTFKFDIPAEIVSADRILSERPHRRVAGLQPGQPLYRILVAEDMDDSRLLLVNLLELKGFEVRAASNGLEAVEIAQKWQPHLIWMDMQMPVMDGYKASETIKAQKTDFMKRKTVIIALSASALKDEMEKTKAAGCDDFLSKPFKSEDVFEMMRKHIGVKYVYAETSKHHPLVVDTAASDFNLETSVSRLPPDLSEKLAQSAVIADMERTAVLIEQVRGLDNPLAEALALLADDFKYNDIAELIRNTKEHTDE